jgi:hypothetical protein
MRRYDPVKTATWAAVLVFLGLFWGWAVPAAVAALRAAL